MAWILHQRWKYQYYVSQLIITVVGLRAAVPWVGVIAILHTFNGRLEFNSHVHTMVTGGGLYGDTWMSCVYYDRDPLMKAWRKAVIKLLRAALRAGQSMRQAMACVGRDAGSGWAAPRGCSIFPSTHLFDGVVYTDGKNAPSHCASLPPALKN